MCMQDIAIGRSAKYNKVQLTAISDMMRVPANPDRIAIYPISVDALGIVILHVITPDNPEPEIISAPGNVNFNTGYMTYQTHPGLITDAHWWQNSGSSFRGYLEVIMNAEISKAVQRITSPGETS
jgi:hypothetical protein